MFLATSDLIRGLGVAIPLVIVFGIFIVQPFIRRRYVRPLFSQQREQLTAIAGDQTRILEELRAMRTRLDEVQRVLAAVE